jgi:hypothetical protein
MSTRPPARRRICKKCGKRRGIEKFTPRGRTCIVCRKSTKNTIARSARLVRTYGITEGEYRDLLAAQGGCCAICKGTRRQNLDVDHDHKHEKENGETRASVRGLLCKRCNRRLLPACLDNPDILRAAIEYLECPPARKVLG